MITSRRNPRVVAAAALHDASTRRASGHTLVEGPHLVAEAVAAGVEVIEMFALEEDLDGRELASRAGAPLSTISRPVLDRIGDTRHPQSPIAVIAIPAADPAAGDAVVCWQIADPGNVGTIIRTAAAFGFGVLWGGEGAADPWAPKVLRAAAGGHFHTTLAPLDGAGLSGPDHVTIATTVAGGTDPAEALAADVPVWLVLGSEAHGLEPAVAHLADTTVTIPLTGAVESLNVAIAGAILMYERSRSRR